MKSNNLQKVPTNLDKILILGNMGIGNLIMFIPTIRAFRIHFPKAKFFLVTNRSHLEAFKDILQQFQLIDEFIVFEGKRASLIERIKYIEKIKRERFDMVIKNFLIGINFMTGLLRVKYRIGHVSSPDFPMRGDFIFNYPVQMEKNEHEIFRNLRLFYAIGGEEKKIEPNFQLEPPEAVQLKVHRIFENSNLISMQIGTSAVGDWKEWPAQRFGELASKLISQYGTRIILLGDMQAKNKGELVEKMVNASPDKLINLIGKTSILEAAAIIKRCKVIVSNDAGLMWVAQAVGVPVIAIYGPTDYRRTGPVGVRDKIIRKDLPCSPCYKSPVDYSKAVKCNTKRCLNSIIAQEVLQQVIEFL